MSPGTAPHPPFTAGTFIVGDMAQGRGWSSREPNVPIPAGSGHRFQANWFPPLRGVGGHEPLLWVEDLGLGGLCRDGHPDLFSPALVMLLTMPGKARVSIVLAFPSMGRIQADCKDG